MPRCSEYKIWICGKHSILLNVFVCKVAKTLEESKGKVLEHCLSIVYLSNDLFSSSEMNLTFEIESENKSSVWECSGINNFISLFRFSLFIFGPESAVHLGL